MKMNRRGNRSSSTRSRTTDETEAVTTSLSLDEKYIRAARKFARNDSVNSNSEVEVVTQHMPERDVVVKPLRSRIQIKRPPKLPSVYDLLNYVCFRGTGVLPKENESSLDELLDNNRLCSKMDGNNNELPSASCSMQHSTRGQKRRLKNSGTVTKKGSKDNQKVGLRDVDPSCSMQHSTRGQERRRKNCGRTLTKKDSKDDQKVGLCDVDPLCSMQHSTRGQKRRRKTSGRTFTKKFNKGDQKV